MLTRNAKGDLSDKKVLFARHEAEGMTVCLESPFPMSGFDEEESDKEGRWGRIRQRRKMNESDAAQEQESSFDLDSFFFLFDVVFSLLFLSNTSTPIIYPRSSSRRHDGEKKILQKRDKTQSMQMSCEWKGRSCMLFELRMECWDGSFYSSLYTLLFLWFCFVLFLKLFCLCCRGGCFRFKTCNCVLDWVAFFSFFHKKRDAFLM